MEKATKDGRLQLPLTHKILDQIVKTKWTFYRMQKKAQGALFVEPSIYSKDHPATNQVGADRAVTASLPLVFVTCAFTSTLG
jgi:hypothetical protein